MVSKFERMSEALGNAEAETRALQKMQKMQKMQQLKMGTQPGWLSCFL